MVDYRILIFIKFQLKVNLKKEIKVLIMILINQISYIKSDYSLKKS